MFRMMKPLLLTAALVVCTADAPAALQKAFEGTVVSTYPDGRTSELWLQPNGDYTAMGRKHERTGGHWSIKGDKLCFKRTHPWAPFGYCMALPTETTFTTKAVTGEMIQVRLEPGRSGEHGS